MVFGISGLHNHRRKGQAINLQRYDDRLWAATNTPILQELRQQYVQFHTAGRNRQYLGRIA